MQADRALITVTGEFEKVKSSVNSLEAVQKGPHQFRK